MDVELGVGVGAETPVEVGQRLGGHPRDLGRAEPVGARAVDVHGHVGGQGLRYLEVAGRERKLAHQWWYGLVGNDIYRQPWLDEALAQYSGIVYAEDVAGAGVAAADWEREVLRRYRGALSDGDLPAGLGIADYPNFNVYYRTVYGKGAVFLHTLRAQLGDDVFFGALRLYYQRRRYQVGTTQDMLDAFEAASRQDLKPLFQQWLGAFS